MNERDDRSPAPRRRAYVVAEVGEIPPGGRKIVTIERREIGIFNVDGEYFALRNRCPHQGAALCEGPLLPTLASDRPGDCRLGPVRLLQCPWHGWEFDLRSGRSWCDPSRVRVRSYKVGCERAPDEQAPGGMVEGPHRAETYPVSVDRRYVVVELDS